MSYDIYDQQGYVGTGPSIKGWTDLQKALSDKNEILYPQMSSMVKRGYANSPVRLKLECIALSKIVPQVDVKKTLIAIGKACAKAQAIVILHNHIGA